MNGGKCPCTNKSQASLWGRPPACHVPWYLLSHNNPKVWCYGRAPHPDKVCGDNACCLPAAAPLPWCMQYTSSTPCGAPLAVPPTNCQVDLCMPTSAGKRAPAKQGMRTCRRRAAGRGGRQGGSCRRRAPGSRWRACGSWPGWGRPPGCRRAAACGGGNEWWTVSRGRSWAVPRQGGIACAGPG